MAREKGKGKARTLRLDWRTRDFVDFLLCEYDDRRKAERYLYLRGYMEKDEELYGRSEIIGEDGNTEEVTKFQAMKVRG